MQVPHKRWLAPMAAPPSMGLGAGSWRWLTPRDIIPTLPAEHALYLELGKLDQFGGDGRRGEGGGHLHSAGHAPLFLVRLGSRAISQTVVHRRRMTRSRRTKRNLTVVMMRIQTSRRPQQENISVMTVTATLPRRVLAMLRRPPGRNPYRIMSGITHGCVVLRMGIQRRRQMHPLMRKL